MDKIALITDTAADLNKDFIEENNIKVLPFRVMYKDREYRDGVDISSDEVYSRMKLGEVPTTSIPSAQDIEELFLKLEKDDYTHAIVITLSSGLSGVLNGIRIISENHPKIKTFLYDSKSISMGEGILVEECAEMMEKGIGFKQITKTLDQLKKKTHLFFVVATLDYLIKGGRIGKVQGTIGELLSLKPIISIDDDGKYYPVEMIRGRNRSLEKLVSIGNGILEKVKCKVFVRHGGATEEGEQVYKELSKHPNAVSISLGNISPVASVHSGPGLIGIVFFETE